MTKNILVALVITILAVCLLGGSFRLSRAQSSDPIAVVGARGADLYASLNLATQRGNQPTGLRIAPGALLTLKGRSADSRFLYVQTEDQSVGWIAVQSILVANVNSIPIMNTTDDPSTTSGTMTTTASTTAPNGTIPTPLTLMATPSTALADNATVAPPSPITATVTLTANRLNLRAGPTTAYSIVARAEPESYWRVVGQTKAGDWLLLHALRGEEQGWAAMRYLALEGSGALPVITEFPRLLAAAPTATPLSSAPSMASEAPDRTLLPTPAATVTSSDAAVATGVGGKSGLSGILAFQDQIGGTIYLYDLDNDTLRPLTTGIDPAISPDRQRVAFTRDGGAGGLYVINSDGSGEQRIYNDHPLLRSPSWSPDGQYIVFSRANGFEDCRVVRGSVCLPDTAILESLPDELQNEPGIHNLVKGIPNQRTYHTNLARIAPDGSNYRDIPALDYAAAPDWNAAGIVYQSNAGIQRTADEGDAHSVEVANDPLVGYFHDPDWQPTNTNAWGRIVFHRKQGSHWEIYAVNPDGTGLVALTRPVTALVDELPSNVSPAWSPDGQHIIYLSNRNSIESAGAWHFWVMDADGGNQRLLPIDVVLNYTFSSEQMVSWAP